MLSQEESRIRLSESMKEPLLAGTLTCFSRSTVVLNEGEHFSVYGIRFIVTRVEKTRMDNAKYRHFKEHGFSHWNHWSEDWDKEHPKNPYRPDKIVWVHHFKMVNK